MSLKMKNKKFTELKPWQKGVFIISCLSMLATLVYTGTHLDSFNSRYDIIEEFNGCTYTFKEGYLYKLECPSGLEDYITNNTIYTMDDYYATKRSQIETEGMFEFPQI